MEDSIMGKGGKYESIVGLGIFMGFIGNIKQIVYCHPFPLI